MRWLFLFALPALMMSALPAEAQDAPAKGANPKQEVKNAAKAPVSLPHAYTRDFERFAFSKDYEGKLAHETPSEETRARVNKLLTGARSYLISRIEKSGKIAEFMYEPSRKREKDRAAVDLKDPESWFIQYRVEMPLALVIGLCVHQEVELTKKEEKKLLAAINYSAAKFEHWQFNGRVGRVSTEDISTRAGWFLLAYEALHEVEKTSFTKKAIKALRKTATRIEEQIKPDWEANPHLFDHYLDHDRNSRGRSYSSSYILAQALTFSPKRATKWRVEFAETLLAFMVETHVLYPKVSAPRYFKEFNLKRLPHQEPEALDANTPKDKALVWSRRIIPDRYFGETIERMIELNRRGRQESIKRIQGARNATVNYKAIRMFVDVIRYLKHMDTKKYQSKSTKRLIAKAEPLLWNVLATMSFGGYHRNCLHAQPGGGHEDYVHELFRSDALDNAAIARVLRRKTLGVNDWYYRMSRDVSKEYQFAEDGSVNGFGRGVSSLPKVHLQRFRFTSNLAALHLLRRQPVGEQKGPITKRGRKSPPKPSEKRE